MTWLDRYDRYVAWPLTILVVGGGLLYAACQPADRALVEISQKIEPCNASPLVPEDAPDGSMGVPTYTFSGCDWRGCWKHKAAGGEWPDEWVCSPGCRIIEETMEVCCGNVD
jgi:hypothetical protein